MGQGWHDRHELGCVAADSGLHCLPDLSQRAEADSEPGRSAGQSKALCPCVHVPGGIHDHARDDPQGSQARRTDDQSADSYILAIAIALGIALLGAFSSAASSRIPKAEKKQHFYTVERVFGVLMVMTACGMAFAHGSNDVANAIGPLAASLALRRRAKSVPKSRCRSGCCDLVAPVSSSAWQPLVVTSSRRSARRSRSLRRAAVSPQNWRPQRRSSSRRERASRYRRRTHSLVQCWVSAWRVVLRLSTCVSSQGSWSRGSLRSRPVLSSRFCSSSCSARYYPKGIQCAQCWSRFARR